MIIGPGCQATDCNRMKCADSLADASGDVHAIYKIYRPALGTSQLVL